MNVLMHQRIAYNNIGTGRLDYRNTHLTHTDTQSTTHIPIYLQPLSFLHRETTKGHIKFSLCPMRVLPVIIK